MNAPVNDVLVVCEGNVCRSPMAEGLIRNACPRLRVASAGLDALVGAPASAHAVELLRGRGIDISQHRGRQLVGSEALRSTLILTATDGQVKRLLNVHPILRGRTFALGTAIGTDIPDPYMESRDAHRDALAIIDIALQDWLPKLAKLLPN